MNGSKKISILIEIIFAFCNFLFFSTASAATLKNNLDSYTEFFYNHYSSHFSANGLSYSVPTYGVIDFSMVI